MANSLDPAPTSQAPAPAPAAHGNVARFEDINLTEGRVLRNQASDVFSRLYIDALGSGGLEAVERASVPGWFFEDQRALIAVPDLESAFSNQDFNNNIGCDSTVVATRGDRVAVVHQRLISSTHAFPQEFLQVAAINADGKVLGSILFDPTDLDAALAEADLQFLEDEGAHCRVIHELSTYMLTQRDATSESTTLDHLLTEDFRLRDHRQLGSGELERSAYLNYLTASAEQTGERSQRVRRLLAFNQDARLAEALLTRGDAEWHMLVLHARDDDQVRLAEIWDATDVDAAIARFHELMAPDGAA